MATNPFVGTATVAERTYRQSLVYKALAKRIAGKLRCGLPGIIISFDPITQYATVRLAITENLIKATGGIESIAIPDLQDVLVLFPGDANWCLTFPQLAGCECYVCFADMCINNWATFGFATDVNDQLVPRQQQLQRRHDLSDGFAILAPRSNPKAIPNYSTTSVELRSMDNGTKIQMDQINGIQFKTSHLGINGTLVPVPGTTTSTLALPIKINGTTYYIRLSNTP
jgi:hypothetical protein